MPYIYNTSRLTLQALNEVTAPIKPHLKVYLIINKLCCSTEAWKTQQAFGRQWFMQKHKFYSHCNMLQTKWPRSHTCRVENVREKPNADGLILQRKSDPIPCCRKVWCRHAKCLVLSLSESCWKPGWCLD